MNGEYEWSESGLQLLQTIQSYIEQHGGRIALANTIMREDKEYFNAQLTAERRAALPPRARFQFTPDHDKILVNLWKIKTLQQLGEILNYRDYKMIKARGLELGLGERDKHVFQESKRPKPVIVQFGDYEERFPSITSAAANLNCAHAYVVKAIINNYHVSGSKVRFA